MTGLPRSAIVYSAGVLTSVGLSLFSALSLGQPAWGNPQVRDNLVITGSIISLSEPISIDIKTQLPELFPNQGMDEAIARLSPGTTPRQRIVNIALSYIGLTPATAPMYSLDSFNPFCAPDDKLCNPWCSEFVSTVFHLASHPMATRRTARLPWLLTSTAEIVDYFRRTQTFVDLSSPAAKNFTPQPGDFVYMVGPPTNIVNMITGWEHSQIVYTVQGDVIQVIEGNNPAREPVRLTTIHGWRHQKSGARIAGFGHWQNAPAIPMPPLCLAEGTEAERECRISSSG